MQTYWHRMVLLWGKCYAHGYARKARTCGPACTWNHHCTHPALWKKSLEAPAVSAVPDLVRRSSSTVGLLLCRTIGASLRGALTNLAHAKSMNQRKANVPNSTRDLPYPLQSQGQVSSRAASKLSLHVLATICPSFQTPEEQV